MRVMDQVMRHVRHYRFDDNPLRRRSDRIESGVLIGVLFFLLLSVWPAVVLGQEGRGNVSAVPDDGSYLVTAVVEAAAVGPGGGNQAGSPRARARWTAPDGHVRTGFVPAPPEAGVGSAFDLWVDDRGRPTTPSSEPSGAPFTVTAAAGEFVLATAMLLFGGFVIVRRCFLDRVRYREWDAAWVAADERWRRSRPS